MLVDADDIVFLGHIQNLDLRQRLPTRHPLLHETKRKGAAGSDLHTTLQLLDILRLLEVFLLAQRQLMGAVASPDVQAVDGVNVLWPIRIIDWLFVGPSEDVLGANAEVLDS